MASTTRQALLQALSAAEGAYISGQQLAQQLGAANVVLYHTEDKTIANRKEAYGAECRKYFTGNVYVPDDLEIILLDR